MVKRSAAVMMLSLAIGCTPPIALPAPAVPDKVMPPLPEPATPPPGSGSVAIAADEPAVVEEPTGHVEGIDSEGNVVDGITYKTVCSQTPCVTSLAFGHHDLRFTSLVDPTHGGTAELTAGEAPVDYRYALGHNHIEPQFARGLWATTLGGAALMGGLMLIGFSGGAGGTDLSSPMGISALGVAAVGAVFTVLGVHWLSNAGETQDGTGAQWTP